MGFLLVKWVFSCLFYVE